MDSSSDESGPLLRRKANTPQKQKNPPKKTTSRSPSKKAKSNGNRGKLPRAAKRGTGGEQPGQNQRPLTHYPMWAHYDYLLKDATKQEMVRINEKMLKVIEESNKMNTAN